MTAEARFSPNFLENGHRLENGHLFTNSTCATLRRPTQQ